MPEALGHDDRRLARAEELRGVPVAQVVEAAVEPGPLAQPHERLREAVRVPRRQPISGVAQHERIGHQVAAGELRPLVQPVPVIAKQAQRAGVELHGPFLVRLHASHEEPPGGPSCLHGVASSWSDASPPWAMRRGG